MATSAPSDFTNAWFLALAVVATCGAEVFGQLDGEGADAARAGVDQHLLSRLQLREIDQRLPGGEPHQRQRRRLHVIEARGLRRRGALAHQGILGDGADAILVEARIDRVADLEFGDAGADRFDVAGEIVAEDQRKRVRESAPSRAPSRIL